MANWAGLAALFLNWRLPRIKYILTLQEGDPLEYIEKRVRFIYPLFKKIFTCADRVQAISNFLAHWAKEKGYQGDVHVIPNGVESNRFENISPRTMGETVVLITTSRLVEKNGVGDVIEAMRLLPEHVHFRILGTGPLGSELKAKVKALGLENRISFAGFVLQEDIPRHLHHADIFVRPSLSEGQGISFIEAMAAGLPVVATPVGGIPDFLTDGETGVLCKPHDPKSIATAVLRLVEDASLRESVRSNALAMVKEKYDWSLIAEEMKGKVFGI
jgi:glycosyltransferase involved in cell wall biosynthesis